VDIQIKTIEIWVGADDSGEEVDDILSYWLSNGWYIIYQTAFNRTNRQGEGYMDKHYTVHVIVFQKG